MDTSHLKKALSFIPHPLIVNIDDFCWLLKWEISNKKKLKNSPVYLAMLEEEKKIYPSDPHHNEVYYGPRPVLHPSSLEIHAVGFV